MHEHHSADKAISLANNGPVSSSSEDGIHGRKIQLLEFPKRL